MNLQEQISRIQSMMDISDINILDKPLQMCGKNPMTGYFRDGYCKTDSSDEGTHTVCSEVDDEFLEFTKSKGNDLSMLKSGDRWCLCAKRWKEAYDEGVAPKGRRTKLRGLQNIMALNKVNTRLWELAEEMI